MLAILPDPRILSIPLHVWLGLVLATLVTTQILIGKQILKVDFKYHRNLMPILILSVLLIHGWYGFQIYFLKK